MFVDRSVDTVALDRFVGWVRTDALPVWASRGYDAAAQRFHERLDLGGRPLPVPHRAMVQARQIYVYAHAALLGWFPDGADLASRAMATMRREFCSYKDGCTSIHFSVDVAPFAPRSMARDAYTHAFVLFAAAFLYRATGDRSLLEFADDVILFLDRSLSDHAHGGVFTDADRPADEKHQNPQMHLLEAYLALAEAAPERPYLDRAKSLIRLFRDRIMNVDQRILPERFDADWRAHPDPMIADVFEPGHHFEWIWLLRWYERLSGDDLAAYRDMLLATATRPSAAADGLIYDQLGGDGRIVRASHRLWPHCEAIKAATASRGGLRDPAAAQLASASATSLLDHFVGHPFGGGWTDQIMPTLAPIVDYVPASSLYHLFLAAAVVDAASSPAGTMTRPESTKP